MYPLKPNLRSKAMVYTRRMQLKLEHSHDQDLTAPMQVFVGDDCDYLDWQVAARKAGDSM